ncbi:60 kDa jasmonate-induced protein-like [Oryza glaberrima]|uniref:60 kDa jasmonate-induced protein-like n=1 Tax=Oryza glaberrima TaxID=4538 RepID=UPI00023E2BF5|nr:60 kDa jasmonate-induced protein-like [Oryza glaberrima]
MKSRVASVLVACILMIAAMDQCVAYDTDPLNPAQTWHLPHDVISFDVAHGDFGDLMSRMRAKIIPYCSNRVDGTWVLPQQTYNRKPAGWLMLELTGINKEADKIMIAIRVDNLYIAGFTDRTGRWYVFSNRARFGIIPGATVLRLDDDYFSLVGGYKALGNLLVSRDSTLRALEEMAGFVPSPSEDAGCLARAVAVMAVTFCETSRFMPIMLITRDNWVNGIGLGGAAPLVVQWKTMSCAVLLSVQYNGRWDSQEADFLRRADFGYSRAGILQDIQLLLLPAWCSKQITWLKPRN